MRSIILDIKITTLRRFSGINAYSAAKKTRVTKPYNSALYVVALSLNPQNYQSDGSAFIPYHFQRDAIANKLYKVFDLEDGF